MGNKRLEQADTFQCQEPLIPDDDEWKMELLTEQN